MHLGKVTNFKWLKCIYDSFNTFYIFCLSKFINNHIKGLNDTLLDIHNLMKDIIIEPKKTNKNGIWKYFIRNKIDINTTGISNIDNVIDSCFGKAGFIKKLFNIFKLNKF